MRLQLSRILVFCLAVMVGCTPSTTEEVQTVSHRSNGFDGAYEYFLAEPNAKQAKAVGGVEDVSAFLDTAQRDKELWRRTLASYEAHVRSPAVLRRLSAVRAQYLTVLKALRAAGLPDVWAAIPFLESRYNMQATSKVCALGWWQLLPEAGLRAKSLNQPEFTVTGCPLINDDGTKTLWSPTEAALSQPLCPNAPYVAKDTDGNCSCRIQNAAYSNKGVCGQDDRTDLEKSTALAIAELRRAWDDPILAASGAGVQLAILSYHAGFDSSVYGGGSEAFNIRPAFSKWSEEHSGEPHHRFYGANLTCDRSDDPAECAKKSALLPRSQHYGYPIIAQHMAAVCFYGINYPKESPIFQEYHDLFVGPGSYCDEIKIKSIKELNETSSEEGGE